MPNSQIINFIKLAFKEGEGLGTGYEYYAKYAVLRHYLREGFTGKMLIAGLPEKYGYSLDFTYYASLFGSKLTVMDDRSSRLSTHKELLHELFDDHTSFGIKHHVINNWASIPKSELYDLALSCEVFQRLNQTDKKNFAKFLGGIAKRVAIFAPNAENSSHVSVSGLKTVGLMELINAFSSFKIKSSGFLDMPPFPPGIHHSNYSKEQRETLGPKIEFIGHGLKVWYHLVESKISKLTSIHPFHHIVYVVGSKR
jgi:hypothetical protein